MPDRRSRRGRPRGALLFCLLLAWAHAGHAAGNRCAADRIDQAIAVEYVHDGDTLRLVDGRSVRLIGIDTPELSRHGRPDEPFARAARDALRDLVRDAGMRLELRYDAERQDRYGRTLAHAYLPDGRSLAEVLLAAGLASQLTVPPNAWQWRCYQAVERAARAARRGLWALPEWDLRDAASLAADARGRVRLRDRVAGVEPRRSGTRLRLASGIVVWVPAEDASAFPDFDTYLGREVEVRGTLGRWRDERQVRVRHPAALATIE